MMDDSPEKHILPLLLARLERISVDSPLAHRASGLRGTLMRFHERFEAGLPVDRRAVRRLIEQGFRILEEAAKERTGGNFKP